MNDPIQELIEFGDTTSALAGHRTCRLQQCDARVRHIGKRQRHPESGGDHFHAEQSVVRGAGRFRERECNKTWLRRRCF